MTLKTKAPSYSPYISGAPLPKPEATWTTQEISLVATCVIIARSYGANKNSGAPESVLEGQRDALTNARNRALDVMDHARYEQLFSVVNGTVIVVEERA